MELYTIIILLLLLLLLVVPQLRRVRNPRQQLPPGPRGLPVAGSLPFLGRLPHAALARISRRHGPIIFLKLGSRNAVVASTPSAARSFLSTRDAAFADRPPHLTSRGFAYGGQDMIFADHGPRWALMRKISSVHLLGAKAVAGWAGIRTEEIRRAAGSVVGSYAAGLPTVVPDLLINTMGNVIGRATMSQRVFDGGFEFKDLVLELLRDVPPNIGDFFPAISWMDLQGLGARARKTRERFDGMITAMLARHDATATERRRDGRSDFVDAVRDGAELAEVNIKGLILDFFVAGTDAASIAAEWAMAEMLRNPDVLRRTRSESDAIVGFHRLLDESDLPNLPYLQSVCKETLRLHPTSGLGIAHHSSEACEVDGYWIPADTILLVNLWAMGRDPSVWEDPMEFRPERFGDVMKGKENVWDLIPFGAGRRMCAGKELGMLMLQYMVGMMVHGFDWKMAAGDEGLDMDEGVGISLYKAQPLSLFLTPRLDPRAYDL